MDKDLLANFMRRFPAKELENGNIRTCPARLSFPYLFKPQAPMEEGGEPKFSATLLFPAGADLSVLHEACKRAAFEHFGQNAGSMRLHMPFRDQGEKQFDGYVAGAKFITATSRQMPGVVGPDRRAITDPNQVYPGCWVLATIRAFGYTHKMKKGVSFGLQNLQKIGDDEPFGAGRSNPEDEFEAIDGTADAANIFGNGAAADSAPWDFG